MKKKKMMKIIIMIKTITLIALITLRLENLEILSHSKIHCSLVVGKRTASVRVVLQMKMTGSLKILILRKS